MAQAARVTWGFAGIVPLGDGTGPLLKATCEVVNRDMGWRRAQDLTEFGLHRERGCRTRGCLSEACWLEMKS